MSRKGSIIKVKAPIFEEKASIDELLGETIDLKAPIMVLIGHKSRRDERIIKDGIFPAVSKPRRGDMFVAK